MAGAIDESSAKKLDLKSEGSTNLNGIMLAGQPLCLAVGLQNGAPTYVSVITASMGAIPEWQIQVVGVGPYTKVFIGTQDGKYWWSTPGGNPYPNCINLIPGPPTGQNNTIILNSGDRMSTLEAPYQPGGYMAPTGGPGGFYFATDAGSSAQVYFVAIR